MKRETRREEGRESYEYGKEESPHTVVLIMCAKKRWFLPLLFAALPWDFIKHFQEDFRIVVFPPLFSGMSGF